MTQQSSPFPSIKDVPASAWEKLAQKKIYFGHQSVGYNIIDGIKDVMKENPQIKLNIVETSNPNDFNSGIFAHSRVGRNMDPKSKTDEFQMIIKNGIGDKADIAALKFCYVDFLTDSNVVDIFNNYQNMISEIKSGYPNLKIIPFTVPLTSLQTGPKAWLKRVLKGSTGDIEDNIKRNEYNKMLLTKHENVEPVFDLAAIESTSPSGSISSFEKDGKKYNSLFSGYTDDGGHLNEKGRRIVAEQLLILLSTLTEQVQKE